MLPDYQDDLTSEELAEMSIEELCDELPYDFRNTKLYPDKPRTHFHHPPFNHWFARLFGEDMSFDASQDDELCEIFERSEAWLTVQDVARAIGAHCIEHDPLCQLQEALDRIAEEGGIERTVINGGVKLYRRAVL